MSLPPLGDLLAGTRVVSLPLRRGVARRGERDERERGETDEAGGTEHPRSRGREC